MERDEAFEFLGINKFRELGYTGSRVKIMSDEKILKEYHNTDKERWKKVICPKGYKTNSGSWHGSAIMNILIDICPDATYIAFPMDMRGTGDKYESKCIDYILENNVHLFTTSCVGGQCSKTKEKAMQDCIDNGTTFFCASGNKGEDGMIGEAKSEKHIAIGALEPNRKLKWASYSSIGKELDYVSIGFYGFGTSFTTPTFCAMCGLVQDFFIAKTGRALVRSELIDFINDNLIDVEDEGFDIKTGHGLFILPDPNTINISKYIPEYSGTVDYSGFPEINPEPEEELVIKEMLLTPSRYTRPKTKIEPDTLAWHYVANPKSTALANRNYFESLKDGVRENDKSDYKYASCHYIIGLDGEILHLIPDNEISHCTNHANIYTISIECCHPDDTGKFTEATYKSMVKLGKYLMQKYNIKNNIRHYDVTGKICPKWFVDNPDEWDKFKKELEGNDDTMFDELVKKYGKEVVIKALDTLIRQQTNNEDISDWAKPTFDKVTKKDSKGNAIVAGVGNGEYDWQQPVTLERLMVILDKLGLIGG